MVSSEIKNPFPGLRPFETSEYNLFFGREGQSDELLERLQRTRFLAVVCTSGSGKSSLIRAGMLPSLYGGLMGQAGSAWRASLMRPGNDPIGELARALGTEGMLGEPGLDAEVQTALIETTLRRSTLGLVEAVRQARLPVNENVLIVIDQFEEVFRFKQARGEESFEDDAAAFVELLLEAAQQREVPVYVVLTMRSDFIGDCAQFWGLPEAINEGQYLIPRMTRDQRREAITGPIAVGGGNISSSLVNRLLNDMGDSPDQLPILQHALMRTWDYWTGHRREGEPIDLRHYEDIGGMENTLSRHADEAYEELPDGRSRLIAERMFKRLTERGSDGREVRRPTRLKEICAVTEAREEEVISVIDLFRKEGRSFLTPPAGVRLDAESIIDISHESLIRNWDRLRRWVDEEAQSARSYARLADAAGLHAQHMSGYWGDPVLQLTLDWRDQVRPNRAWGGRYHPDFDLAMSFLEASRVDRDAQVEARAERERRELEMTKAFATQQAAAARRFRWLAVALAVMFLLSLGVTAYAVAMKRLADTNARIAAASARSEAEARKDLEMSYQSQSKLLTQLRESFSSKEALVVDLERQKKLADENAERADKKTTEALYAQKETEKALSLANEQTELARRLAADEKRAKDEATAALNRDTATRETNKKYRDAISRLKQGQVQKARAEFESVAKDFIAIPDFAGAAACHIQIGDSFFVKDNPFEGLSPEDLKQGLESYEKAAELYGRIPDHVGQASALTAQGKAILDSLDSTSSPFETTTSTSFVPGNPKSPAEAEAQRIAKEAEEAKKKARTDEGVKLLEEALKLYNKEKNAEGAISVLTKLAFTRFYWAETKERPQGAMYVDQMLPLYRELKDWTELKKKIVELFRYYIAMGNKKRAEEYQEMAVRIFQDNNDLKGEAEILTSIADALLYSGKSNLVTIFGVLERARAAYERANLSEEQAAILEKMASIDTAIIKGEEGDSERALRNLRKADDLYRQLDNKIQRKSVLESIASVSLTDNKLTEAINAYQQLADLYSDEPLARLTCLYKIGGLKHKLGLLKEALGTYEQALELISSEKIDEYSADLLLGIAAVHRDAGELKASLEFYREAVKHYGEFSLPIINDEEATSGDLGKALLGLAEVQESLGEMSAALQTYRDLAAHYRLYRNTEGEQRIEMKIKDLQGKGRK